MPTSFSTPDMLSRLPWRRLAALACVPLLAGCDLGVESPFVDRILANPTPVPSNVRFAQIASGFFHTCALTSGGNAWCWGSNQWAQVGTTAVLPACQLGTCSYVPVTSGDGRAFRQIATGSTHTCAIGVDGFTYCWGGSPSPTGTVLGDGGSVRSLTPLRVRTDSLFVQVTVGGGHSCGITSGGTALCWGRNEVGQLGDSTTVNASTPVQVVGDVRFASISAGSDFTCGVSTAAAIHCWGSNQFGQLGTGDVTFNVPRTTVRPTPIASTQTWTAVASGGSHACALATDGRISCWGRNDSASQLGDSSATTHSGTPGPIRSTLTFASVHAGAGTTCARTEGGDLWCWGGNAFGNVGNGRIANAGEPVPQKVGGGPYASVSAGASHTCAIEVSGGTRCWGDRFYGQTGSR
jgi:alpha-tubulin suppressor-like RCC1 family protein